jgi:hypothetical protein
VPEIIAQTTEQVRPAIAQLPGPDAELMPGVDRGQRFRPRRQLVTGEDFGKIRTIQQLRRQAEQVGDLRTDAHHVRRRQGLRLEAGVKSFRQRRETVVKGRKFERQGFRGVHGRLCLGSVEKCWAR